MATAKTPSVPPAATRPDTKTRRTPAPAAAPVAAPRRGDALTREGIVEASIALLDSAGVSGLTFRALAERLATGPGAIYWHIDDKNDLLTAACDAVVARSLAALASGGTPRAHIRAVALAMFDAIDARPWLGTALTQAAGQLPVVRILEPLGQQVRALGVVRHKAQWTAANALLSYILGVAGQNAANAQAHRAPSGQGDRAGLLAEVAAAWSALDPVDYPFTRSLAGQLREHDDREDFLAGIDLILAGLAATPRPR